MNGDSMKRKLGKFSDGATLYKVKNPGGQWIYTIARNTFIDYVRRRRDNLSIDAITSPSVAPTSDEERYDIIQTVITRAPEKLCAFCAIDER